jgi:hypothetical protein
MKKSPEQTEATKMGCPAPYERNGVEIRLKAMLLN